MRCHELRIIWNDQEFGGLSFLVRGQADTASPTSIAHCLSPVEVDRLKEINDQPSDNYSSPNRAFISDPAKSLIFSPLVVRPTKILSSSIAPLSLQRVITRHSALIPQTPWSSVWSQNFFLGIINLFLGIHLDGKFQRFHHRKVMSLASSQALKIIEEGCYKLTKLLREIREFVLEVSRDEVYSREISLIYRPATKRILAVERDVKSEIDRGYSTEDGQEPPNLNHLHRISWQEQSMMFDRDGMIQPGKEKGRAGASRIPGVDDRRPFRFPGVDDEGSSKVPGPNDIRSFKVSGADDRRSSNMLRNDDVDHRGFSREAGRRNERVAT
jgi:hypothetical protein